MNISTLTLGTLLAMAMSTATYAAEGTPQNCDTETSSVFIQLIEPLDQQEDVGGRYEAYLNSIKALEKTGHFKNMKIASQQMLLRKSYNHNNRYDFTVNMTIDFDTNYDAYSDLATKIESTSLDIMTKSKPGCQ